MTISPEEDRALARQARLVSIVIAVAMILWLGGQWLGGKLGLEARYVFFCSILRRSARWFGR